MPEQNLHNDLLELTTNIVSNFLSKNTIAHSEIPTVIKSTYDALSGLGTPAVPEPVKQEPAVPIRNSVKPDYIVCLEDGKKMKMLKRYIMTHYDLTPDEYRAKWGLPKDYPMVAPNYADARRELAKTIGLGRGGAGKPPIPPKKAAAPAPKPKAEAPAKPKEAPAAPVPAVGDLKI